VSEEMREEVPGSRSLRGSVVTGHLSTEVLTVVLLASADLRGAMSRAYVAGTAALDPKLTSTERRCRLGREVFS
jgi:hypothetical protein